MGCGCGGHHCDKGMGTPEMGEKGCHQCQGRTEMMGPKMLMKKAMMEAMVKLLAERLEPKLEEQLGGKMDQVAEIMVQMMLAKRNAKVDLIKQKMLLRQQLRELLFGEEEDSGEEE